MARNRSSFVLVALVAISFGSGFGGGDGKDGSGGGGGSGIWGYASARPVSTISVGKDGASVKR